MRHFANGGKARLHLRLPVRFGLMAALIQTAITPALADYLLRPGDVVEISVSGAPDFHRRTMISDDGKVSFPLLGEIGAADLSVSQLRARVLEGLAARKAFDNPDVTVEIFEYRPVYVSGDVAKPGAVPYRPGMRVRDAVAVAGGFDVMQLRGRDVLVEAVNARGDYDKLSIESTRLDVHVARLQAELADRTEIDLKHVRTAPAAPKLLDEMARIETQQLKADQEDFEKEKEFLGRMIKATQGEIATLDEAEKQEGLGLAELQKDVERTQALLQKGLVPISRLEDQQRAITVSQGRLLDVTARAEQARRDLEKYGRDLQRLGDQRTIDLMQQLQKTIAESAVAKAGLESAGDRLLYTGAEKKQALQNGHEARTIVINRNAHGEPQSLPVDQDAALEAGDAVEITARSTFDALSALPPAPSSDAPPATAPAGAVPF
jgi:polysaccharide export outer membrane protein